MMCPDRSSSGCSVLTSTNSQRLIGRFLSTWMISRTAHVYGFRRHVVSWKWAEAGERLVKLILTLRSLR
jgi:hypothetical protein